MATLLLVAAGFIQLTAIDGAPVKINPDEIVSMRPPRPTEMRTLHEKVRCIISTGDGKFTAVFEACDDVQAMIRALR